MKMNCLKVELEPISSFITKIESDTLFGVFCWNLLYKYGENRLIELLKTFNEEPFIIFSNAFSADKLPKPYLKPVISNDKNIKNIKKTGLLNKVDFIGLLKNNRNKNIPLTLNQINDLIRKRLEEKQTSKKSGTEADIEENIESTNNIIIQKNFIDRLGNYSNNKLFAVEETFYSKDIKLNIFVKYSDLITKDEIKEVFKLIAVNGFGKDKSTGKGKFHFSIIEEFEEKELLNPPDNIDKYWIMSLSNAFINDINNNELIKYKFIQSYVKFPKMGGIAANSDVPFKNPIVLITPGSTFKPVIKKEYYGNAVKNVFASKYNEYWHSGYIVPFFFIGE
jgi:CRISPR-associated protein Csm4